MISARVSLSLFFQSSRVFSIPPPPLSLSSGGKRISWLVEQAIVKFVALLAIGGDRFDEKKPFLFFIFIFYFFNSLDIFMQL